MPWWAMRVCSLFVVLLGCALGIAGNNNLFGWWSPTLVPLALVFAGLISAAASVTIRDLEQRVQALEQRQRAADAQLVPVSVRTEPAFLPPVSDIQSGRSQART
jgi:hypothetical protein